MGSVILTFAIGIFTGIALFGCWKVGSLMVKDLKRRARIKSFRRNRNWLEGKLV